MATTARAGLPTVVPGRAGVREVQAARPGVGYSREAARAGLRGQWGRQCTHRPLEGLSSLHQGSVLRDLQLSLLLVLLALKLLLPLRLRARRSSNRRRARSGRWSSGLRPWAATGLRAGGGFRPGAQRPAKRRRVTCAAVKRASLLGGGAKRRSLASAWRDRRAQSIHIVVRPVWLVSQGRAAKRGGALQIGAPHPGGRRPSPG